MKKLFLLSYSLFIISYPLFAQNIGIGTTSPVTKLHVDGIAGNIATFNGGNGMWITLAEAGNNRGYIGSFSGNAEDVDFGTYSGNIGKVHLTTNNTPRLTVMNNGNIGIGTTNPQQLFSVAGGMNIDQNDQNNGTVLSMLRFGSFSGEGIASRRTAGVNQYGLDLYTNSTNRMTITNTGNIGVGTLTPAEKLTINGAINLGNTTNELPGTIRFNNANNDFEGFDGTQWRSLTATGIFQPALSDTGSNQQAGDNFGFVVKMLDDYLFVGAPGDDIGANNGQGSVTIYRKNNFTNKYEFFQNIVAPDGAAGDAFGTALEATVIVNSLNSFHVEYLIVGAPKKTVSGHSQQGTVYLFARDYYTGQFRIVLNGIVSPADGAAGDQFGSTLMINEVVGDIISFLSSAPTKTINGNLLQGRVYRCQATLAADAYIGNLTANSSIDAPYPVPFGFFGYAIGQVRCDYMNYGTSVSVHENCSFEYLLIGAPGTTVNGQANRGKVFAFANNYDTAIINSDGAAGDNFGISIAMDYKRFYIGASGKQVGANSSQGKVYVFRDTITAVSGQGIRWCKEVGQIVAADGQANDRFGNTIKVWNNFLLVSAINRDDPATDAGAVYVFEKSLGVANYNHPLRKIVTDPLAQTQNFMGKSFDVKSNNYVIGVPDWDNPGRTNSGKIIFGTIY